MVKFDVKWEKIVYKYNYSYVCQSYKILLYLENTWRKYIEIIMAHWIMNIFSFSLLLFSKCSTINRCSSYNKKLNETIFIKWRKIFNTQEFEKKNPTSCLPLGICMLCNHNPINWLLWWALPYLLFCFLCLVVWITFLALTPLLQDCNPASASWEINLRNT